MADEFLLYLRLGVSHITDLAGYDHILFVLALAAVYRWREWRQVALLVTAFTVGHSITLALATVGTVRVRAELVEFLIPCTILATCLANLVDRPQAELAAHAGAHRSLRLRYAVTIAFGCIHGLGFSTYLRALLGAEEQIVRPLLAFNIGLEVGQLAIVAAGLTLGEMVLRVTPITPRGWVRTLSLVIAAVASWLAVERSIF